MKRVHLLLFLTLASGALAPVVTGQVFNRVEETHSNSTSYYFYVQPGAATIGTYVYGTVRAPGLYVVEEGTDMGQLLALAGGPVLNVQSTDNRRFVTVRLFRPLSYNERPIFETELGRTMIQREPYPLLRNGDILTVEVMESRRFNWRDALTVVGGLAAMAVAIERGISITSSRNR